MNLALYFRNCFQFEPVKKSFNKPHNKNNVSYVRPADHDIHSNLSRHPIRLGSKLRFKHSRTLKPFIFCSMKVNKYKRSLLRCTK